MQSSSGEVVQFNPPRDPMVSVIVVATGAAPYLMGCLRALAANTQDVPFEVIVVENGLEPSTSDHLAFAASAQIAYVTPPAPICPGETAPRSFR